MTDQWKDWEDYNNGLQGTPTGSAYNDMGLRDRKQRQNSNSNSNKVKNSANKNHQEKQAAPTKKQGTPETKGEKQWKTIFFFGALILSCLIMADQGVKEPLAYILVGGGAGIIAASLYKAILAIMVAGAILGALTLFVE